MASNHADDSEIQALASTADAVLDRYRAKPETPSVLYHYTSIDAAVEIASSRTIWCSNVAFSNDPSEADYGRKFLDEIVPKDKILNLRGLRQVINGLDCYAASFSAEGDLLPQWRAYCRNGRGIAVGIGTNELRHRQSMLFMRVLYDPDEQEQIIRDLLDVFRPALVAASNNTERLKELMQPLAIYLVIARSVLKSRSYESEREYRLYDTLPKKLPEPHKGLQFRTSGGALIPFLIADLTATSSPFAQQPVRDLVVGPCLDYERLSASLDLLKVQKNRQFNVTPSTVSMRCE